MLRTMLFTAAVLLVLGLLLAISIVPVFSHDASDPDAEWYQSLRVPGVPNMNGIAGTSCCNGGQARDADCKNVEVRQRKGHWEAWIDSKTFPESKYSPIYGHAPNDWVMVPDEVIIHGKNNPTGGFVACWYNSSIRCFVEGTQT